MHLGLRDVLVWQYLERNAGYMPSDLQVLRRILVFDGALFILLAFPSALFALGTARNWIRAAAFGAIVAFAYLLVFPPDWLAFWRGPPEWLFWPDSEGSWPGVVENAPRTVPESWWSHYYERYEALRETLRRILPLGCLATLAINLPRILLGLREVWRAGAAKARLR